MIIHKIIGALLAVSPLPMALSVAPNNKRIEMIWMYIVLLIMIGGGCLLLAGCTTTKPVEVPVPVACVQPKLPAEPHYPIKDLKTGDSPATVIKAYVATAAGQHDYIERVKYIYAADK